MRRFITSNKPLYLRIYLRNMATDRRIDFNYFSSCTSFCLTNIRQLNLLSKKKSLLWVRNSTCSQDRIRTCNRKCTLSRCVTSYLSTSVTLYTASNQFRHLTNCTHGRTRTYNSWFWRPVLFQLSYARVL
jgi:hypothetical protein